MRPFPVLLAMSLAVNAALAVAWLRRPPAPLRPPAPVHTLKRADDDTRAADARRADDLLAALASGDSAAMTAAGVPADVVRQLAAARAFGRLAKISRTMERQESPDYWRRSRQLRATVPARQAEHRTAELEFVRAMRDAFGDSWNEDWPERYSFLPVERQENIRRIERDYEEMRRAIELESEGLQLPADKEKLRLLQEEMKRDLAAAISPAERAEMQRRSTHSARTIIDQYGDVLASEDEYKRLYELRKAFDDRYDSPEANARPRTAAENNAQAEAERKLNDDLRAAIGEERWARVSPDNDREYRVLGTLTARLGLAAGTPEAVYAMRDTYAAQSLALQHNGELTESARRQQLVSLAARAKDDLRARLGPAAADAYLPHAAWLHALQDGAAFVTNPSLLPPGSPRPSGDRTSYPLPAPPLPRAVAAPKP